MRIDDLNRRRDATRWPTIPFDTGWSSGTNDRVLRDLVHYWRHEYDWFATQERLNRLTHLRGSVGGEALCIAFFTRVRGAGAAPRCLLLHGWPSSFVEFLDAAELLAGGMDGNPGLTWWSHRCPASCFQRRRALPGCTRDRWPRDCMLLMQELGFKQYGVQGGDWGAIIGTTLARQHPESVVGLHVNFVHPAQPPPKGRFPPRTSRLTTPAPSGSRRRRPHTARSRGRGRRHSLTPSMDSPVGLLAWILEKFWAWSDHGDDLWQTLDRDRFLTNVMLYWLPGCVLSSARIYYETFFICRRN